jgi:transcription elongation factor Elf1
MFEHYFQCPYCWETISVLVDLSVPGQTYVEDCEVCCNPMEITVTCSEGELQGFEARELGQ